MLFILGTGYLYLGVLRLHMGEVWGKCTHQKYAGIFAFTMIVETVDASFGLFDS